MTLFSNDPIESDFKVPLSALLLSLGGLIPFLAGGFLAITTGGGILTSEQADRFLISYGAIILSFVAGIRWGAAFSEHNSHEQAVQFSVSVLPALVGWFALFLPFAVALPLLALAHSASAVWDIRGMYNGRGPRWYAKLRMILAIVVVGVIVVVGLVRYFSVTGV